MASSVSPISVSFQAEAAQPGPASAVDAAAEHASSATRPRWRARRWFLMILASGVVLGVVGLRWWSYASSHVTTDNAYLAGHIHLLSSRVPGTVATVLMADNQRVASGTPLLKLDTRDADLQLAQAHSQLYQAEAQVGQAEALGKQAQAQCLQAEAKAGKSKAELEKARLDLDRANRLREKGRFAAISQQEYDAVEAAFAIAQAATRLAEADARASQAQLESAQAARSAAQAQRHTAELRVADAGLQLSYDTIAAPVDGRIGRKNVEIGQRVQPGQALAALVGDDKWIVANFKETQLAWIRPGQPVSIRIDSIPGRTFAGTVESLSPASGAEFALLPPDNATGNFTKVVQRVPVKIVFGRESVCGWEERLVPGLSVVVSIPVSGKQE